MLAWFDFHSISNQFKCEACSSRLITPHRVPRQKRSTDIKHVSINAVHEMPTPVLREIPKCYIELSNNSSSCAFLCVTCNTNDKCQNNGGHGSHIQKLSLHPLEANFFAVDSRFMTGVLASYAQALSVFRCWRRNAVGFDQVKKSDNVPAASWTESSRHCELREHFRNKPHSFVMVPPPSPKS